MRYTKEATPVTNVSVAIRQAVSKERAAGCPQGWKESLDGHLRLGTDHPSIGLTCACGKV
jgi:hypothetical protein